MEEETISLVVRARDGDSDAVGRLFTLYRLRVLRFCLSFARIEPADARDIAQDVFVRAFVGLKRLRKVESFEGWLYAIARSRCLSFLERRKRQEDGLAQLRIGGTQDREEEERMRMMNRVERRVVREAIERLPDSMLKEAGRRFYVEGKDTSAIAEEFDVPVSTVTTWLSRFRGKIRKRLLVNILELRGHAGVSP